MTEPTNEPLHEPARDTDGAPAEELSEEERAERRRRAGDDLKRLTRYALRLSAAGMALAAVPVLLGWSGSDSFLRGLIVGCLVSVLNLHVLARASWALLADKDIVRALLGFAASFTLLVGAATFLAFRAPELVLGFGIGLALPAPAGVWFGLRLQHNDADDPSERA